MCPVATVEPGTRIQIKGDDVAKVCLKHLPSKVRGYIQSYGVRDFASFTCVFKNGHEVAFRANWKEFVAECILVHDLPPIER